MPFTRPTAAQLNLDVINMTDPLIRLNSGETGSADKDAGIVIERGDDTNVALIYDESANQFAIINTNETGTTSGNVTIASYADIKANAFYGDGSNLTNIPGAFSIVSDGASLTSTTSGSDAEPVITLHRDITGVDANYIGQIKFTADNDANQSTVFAKITGKILDASDGTEDGIIEFAHKKAGSNVITGRWRSDSLQLLNDTSLTVAGTTTLSGTLNNHTIPSGSGTFALAGNVLALAGGTMSGAIAMGTNRITGVGDPTASQDVVTKAYFEANASEGGGASGFTSSTFTTMPGADGNFDLAKQQSQSGSVETPFVAGAQDAFGVSLGEVYSMMEPLGSTTTLDLGAFT